MQDQRGFVSDKPSAGKSQKKKPAAQKASRIPGDNVKKSQDLRSPPFQMVQKASKRSLSNEASPLFQQSEKSNSDSLPDSSTSGNEYRALRRKYLLLEEESFEVGRELEEVDNEIKALEEEKLTLLDDLVVLEGLVDPSEIPSRDQRLQ